MIPPIYTPCHDHQIAIGIYSELLGHDFLLARQSYGGWMIGDG